ncbi:MAG: SDR family NAD(P)-dependent oxidoreductase [Thermoanaerobaculia bacterium]
MRPLTGKCAVVTGGGRGIGQAVAEELAAEGAALVVAARSLSEVEAVAARLRSSGAQTLAVSCDVTDPKQVAELGSRARELTGQVDILVNNAGIASSAPLKSLELADFERILAVNVRGVFLCTKEFAPEMAQRGWGRVVNVASVAGLRGAAYISAYTASKHAVLGLTRSLAIELAAKGVTVNAVCPGYVETPMTEGSVRMIVEKTGSPPAEARERLARMSPQKRIFEPDEVAYLVRCLCDPRARGVNGQAWALDGGDTYP